MHNLLFEMDWVPALRSDVLTLFFRAVTELGSNWFALLLLAAGLLLGRGSTFTRLIVVCAFSEILNVHLKSAYMAPRPDLSYRLVDVTGWSFPSGHAQHGMVMWLWLAWEVGKPGAWVVGGLLAIAIALSRVYLGAHYGADIVAGSLLGLAMIAYFLWLFDHRRSDLDRSKTSIVLGLITAFQLLWYVLATQGERVFTFLPAVIYICFLSGIVLGREWSLFEKSRFWWAIAATIAVFGVGLFTELRGGSSWIGPLGLGIHPISVHIQFALLGIWMGLVAPIVFKKLEITG